MLGQVSLDKSPAPGVSKGKVTFVYRLLPGGQRDSSFGNGTGDFAGVQFLNDARTPTTLLAQPDGKVVFAGATAKGFFVRRLTAQGKPDTTFGTAGEVVTDLSPLQYEEAKLGSAALQPDGKILMGGGAHDQTSFGSDGASGDQLVARYTADGKLDTGFGNGGIKRVGFARYGVSTDAIQVRPQGQILVAGTAEGGVGPSCTLLALKPDGNVDPSYNPQIINTTQLLNASRVSLAIQPDGRALLGGCGLRDLNVPQAVFRFNTDGSADTSFGEILFFLGEGDDFIGARVSDGNSLLVQPASVGGKIISGTQSPVRLWP